MSVARLSRVVGIASLLATIAIRSGWASDCTVTSTGFVPLNDLATGRYLGQFEGGLYPDGSNEIPPDHLAAGLAAAAAVTPRDPTGAPDPGGKIVLISVGMSNTTMEFCGTDNGSGTCAPGSFMQQAAASPAVDHASLVIVNGAKGGEPAPSWVDPAGENYERVAALLAEEGLSEAQVQVAWVKQANPVPSTSLPAGNADAYVLEAELGAVARALKQRYPNLRQAFFSSRIYAGYATTELNPEPYAYESGFAVKWLVEAQIRETSSPSRPIDPIAGDLDYETVAPWIAWGPYLWADGTTPRSDGLGYACGDLLDDGTHPARGAIEKVAGLLLDFFLQSSVTAPWFATTLPPCPSLPAAGCRAASSASVSLRRREHAERNTLRWQWSSPAATPTSDFGSPTNETGYRLCMYDDAGLALEASVPGAATCRGGPCWKPRRSGFRYRDPRRDQGGLARIVLAGRKHGGTLISVYGKGQKLPVPPMPLGVPVEVQWSQGAAGACWAATFAAPTRNDSKQFRAAAGG